MELNAFTLSKDPISDIKSVTDIENAVNIKDRAYYIANRKGGIESHGTAVEGIVFFTIVRINLEKKDDTKIVKFFANLNKFRDTLFYPAGIIPKKVNTRIVFMADLQYLEAIQANKQIRKRLDKIISNLNARVKVIQSYLKGIVREAKVLESVGSTGSTESTDPENSVNPVNPDAILIMGEPKVEEVKITLTIGETNKPYKDGTPPISPDIKL